jgi:Domain of unknown function (DUF4157)
MTTVAAPKSAPSAVARTALVNKAAATSPAQFRTFSPPVTVQLASTMKVSSPNDPAEKEAEETAKRVMQGSAVIKGAKPAATTEKGGSVGKGSAMRTVDFSSSPYLARMAGVIVPRDSALSRMIAEAAPRQTSLMRAVDVHRQKRSASTLDGQVDVSANLAAEIRSAKGGGNSLPPSVRRFMEPRFEADFSAVRVHTGAQAASMSQQLSAKAFTIGQDIFFGDGQFKPESRQGKELIAHELTHTVQQGGAKQGPGAQRSIDDSTVHREPVPEGTIQRDLLPDPWDYVLEKADSLPGYPLFKVIIGYDPLRQTSVERSAGNILEGVISLLPVIGATINKTLGNWGFFDKVSAWVKTQFNAVKDIGKNIWSDVKKFIKNLGASIVGGPSKVWNDGKALITGPVEQVIGLAKSLGTGIVELIKDLIIKPIGAYAQGTAGYKILSAILGHDPITKEPATLDGEALMGQFMALANQSETWATIRNAKAIPRTVAWFKSNLGVLKGFVSAIPGLFMSTLKSLTITDIIILPLAFGKFAKAFGSFIGDFVSWGAKAMWDLLEIVFDVVKPGVMGYVKRTGGALKGILKNPMPFVRNLANAGKTGFNMFAGNFLNHLKKGLLNWLTGSLPGVYIPKSFDLMELFKLGLSVLGLSWANMRVKLVKVLGEKPVAFAEGAVDVIKTLKNQGPMAAWAQIKGHLTSLTGTIVDGISGLIVDAIVKKAIPKVVAMFIPGAGFISAIMSIVTLVTTVYENIKQIAAVANAIVSSIVQIAAGNIAAAAKKVESILAGMLSIAINFLLNFAVGKIADKVMGVIQKVRAPVDKALDAAIGWVVGVAKKLLAKLMGKDGKAGKPEERSEAEKDKDKKAAIAEAEQLMPAEGLDEDAVRGKLGPIKTRYRLTSLILVMDSQTEEEETAHFEATASPNLKGPKRKVPQSAKTMKIGSIEIPREKMRWSKDTKVELAQEFVDRGGPKSAVDTKTGKIQTKKKYGRRHIVSFADIQTHYLAAFPAGMTVEKAVKLLGKFGQTAEFKKPSVHSKVRSLAKSAFNDYGHFENLWIGPQAENSSFGAKVDPSPAMLTGDQQSKQRKLDDHIAKFVGRWGAPGVPFTVTGNYTWIAET